MLSARRLARGANRERTREGAYYQLNLRPSGSRRRVRQWPATKRKSGSGGRRQTEPAPEPDRSRSRSRSRSRRDFGGFSRAPVDRGAARVVGGSAPAPVAVLCTPSGRMTAAGQAKPREKLLPDKNPNAGLHRWRKICPFCMRHALCQDWQTKARGGNSQADGCCTHAAMSSAYSVIFLCAPQPSSLTASYQDKPPTVSPASRRIWHG